MAEYIVSYYPSNQKIHNIYDTIEEAKKDVKLCNAFSKGLEIEPLQIALAELTDEEYAEFCKEAEE